MRSLNFRKFRQLTLNGQTYEAEQLMLLCREKLIDSHIEHWERAMYQFIIEWLNDQDSVIVQTSGSTGTPKQMRVKKNAMLQSAFNTIEFFGLHNGMSALLCLPAEFIAGKMMIVRAFAGRLNLLPIPVCGKPLVHLTKSADFSAMTPMQMMNELSDDKSPLHLLKKVILGGSGVGQDLVRRLKHQPFRAWETYGMTETLSHIALKLLNGTVVEDFFTPLKNVAVSTDERNCLVVNVRGITRRPLVTNDLAEVRADGTFRIIGRIDNLINTGGIKVSPEEIEKRLSEIIDRPFYISSRPHPSLGQEIILVVEKKPDNIPDLLNRIKSVLPPYHAPRDIVAKGPFAMTGSGKIRRE
ncbi:AMP-binding protein [Thermophagus sp. OGC60D27]|uniref:AMP-binding protein n=1 Tax=Thermophagus sp. OGC60D27 TaxID=3458415 RepID=UPI004037E83E